MVSAKELRSFFEQNPGAMMSAPGSLPVTGSDAASAFPSLPSPTDVPVPPGVTVPVPTMEASMVSPPRPVVVGKHLLAEDGSTYVPTMAGTAAVGYVTLQSPMQHARAELVMPASSTPSQPPTPDSRLLVTPSPLPSSPASSYTPNDVSLKRTLITHGSDGTMKERKLVHVGGCQGSEHSLLYSTIARHTYL